MSTAPHVFILYFLLKETVCGVSNDISIWLSLHQFIDVRDKSIIREGGMGG